MLEALQQRDRRFLRKCEKDSRFHKRGGNNYYIARNKAGLGSEHFQKYPLTMDNGWFLSTQTQNQEKWKLILAAADVAGLEVRVDGKMWQAERRSKREVGFLTTAVWGRRRPPERRRAARTAAPTAGGVAAVAKNKSSLAAPHLCDQRLKLRHPCGGRLRLGFRLPLVVGQFVAGRQERASRRVVLAQETVQRLLSGRWTHTHSPSNLLRTPMTPTGSSSSGSGWYSPPRPAQRETRKRRNEARQLLFLCKGRTGTAGPM